MQSRNVDPQKPIQQFPAALQPVVERLQHLQDMPQVNHEEMSAGCAPNVVAIDRNFMRLCMGQLSSQQQTSQLLLAAMPPNGAHQGAALVADIVCWLWLQVDQCTVNEYSPGVGLSPHIDTHSAFTGRATPQTCQLFSNTRPTSLLQLSGACHYSVCCYCCTCCKHVLLAAFQKHLLNHHTSLNSPTM